MDQWNGRLDYVVNGGNSVFFKYGQNPFAEFRGLVFAAATPAEPSGNTPTQRNGRNWVADWTSTLSPRMTFNLRAGLARWEEASGNSFGTGYDPRQLGFDSSLVAQFTRHQFPGFVFGSYQQLGNGSGIAPANNDVYTIQPNFSVVHGKHLFKFGFEGRQYKETASDPGASSGSYTFNKNWTQQRAQTADAVSGNELATFLLGYPSAASVAKNIDPYYTNRYYALFIQDD